jgi:hypothetical protein
MSAVAGDLRIAWRALAPAVQIVSFEADPDEAARLRGERERGDPVRAVGARRAPRARLWRLGNLARYASHPIVSHTVLSDVQAFDSRLVSFDAKGGQVFWAHAWYMAPRPWRDR